MKRVLMMCFMLIIVFTMIGCNSSHNNKESIQWCDYLNRKINYYELNELVDRDRITTSEFVKKFESVKWSIYKEEDVNKIIDIINVPYIDYSEVNESTDSVYDLLFKGSDDFYFIEFDINEDKGL